MRWIPIWLFVLAGQTGCVEEEERPDLIPVCEDSCDPGAGQSGGSGPSSSTTTSGTSTTSGDDPIILNGNLGVFANDRFELDTLLPFGEPATVFSQDPDNRVIRAEYDGLDFSLTDLVSGEATAVLVVPDAQNGVPWPTLLRVDTLQSRTVTLPLVSSEVLNEVYAGLGSQPALDPDRGQLILRFSNENLDPIPGVRVEVPGAAFLAYADGSGWSEDADETDASGLVIAGNILATDFPGSAFTVSSSGAAVSSWVVTAIKGAASYDSLIALAP
ncbi:MAG TPA: hypothetical protein VI197_10910 [Polyangiaceae bacterium]